MTTTSDNTPAPQTAPAVPTTAQDEAFRAFRRAYPEYDATIALDALRSSDYSRLDELGQVYLDYTGGNLYGVSQLRAHHDFLAGELLGNPHSENIPSHRMTEIVEGTRAHILGYFNASPDEYTVIFTPNATGALKLVGESYPFGPESTYLLTFDNHNSVNGIREFARGKGAQIHYIAVTPDEMRVEYDPHHFDLAADTVEGHRLIRGLVEGLRDRTPEANNLFAFPGQSNFSGVQHPLVWIAEAKAAGWDVLLDAAAFAPTNRLDLSVWKPDFVSLSFYKIFGYPTGVGALVVRHEALAKLRRPWYAGGTITFSSVLAAEADGQGFYMTPGPAGFEDGTIDYLAMPAIDIGLRHISRVGIDTIHARVMALTGWLLSELGDLCHSNGAPMLCFYGPRNTHLRGATVAMNFLDPDGVLVDSQLVEQLANVAGIALRAGCHCNPGAREVALGFTEDEMADAFRGKENLSYDEFIQVIDGKTTGAARASLGLATTFADVYRLWEFATTFRDRAASELTWPTG